MGCCSFDLRLFGLCYGLFVLVVGLVVGALMQCWLTGFVWCDCLFCGLSGVALCLLLGWLWILCCWFGG